MKALLWFLCSAALTGASISFMTAPILPDWPAIHWMLVALPAHWAIRSWDRLWCCIARFPYRIRIERKA